MLSLKNLKRKFSRLLSWSLTWPEISEGREAFQWACDPWPLTTRVSKSSQLPTSFLHLGGCNFARSISDGKKKKKKDEVEEKEEENKKNKNKNKKKKNKKNKKKK